MKAQVMNTNIAHDAYPGMKVLKTRDVSSFRNTFYGEESAEESSNPSLFQFERIDNVVDEEKDKLSWIDRLFIRAKTWMEEDIG